ncbi:MAG: glutamate formimidoyltransferase [bacterium]|nr:glutamate formimidoyltransferase [bacterium]
MGKIISVIPNICEGTDDKFIDNLAEQLKTLPNLAILDISMDKTRNRTVFAFTGTKEAIFEGLMLLYEESIKKIDMRKHKGEYPRIGAVDVVPFVPLNNVTIEEAIELSNEFAELVVKRFNVPVYLYSESARHALRKDVEKVRETQYEGLEERLKDPEWKPDLGPDEFKPDFGATIIGARYPIVSFKIFLETRDWEVTKHICNAIQYSGGGLRYVTANAGVVNDESHRTQIAVSISNYIVTPVYKVIEMARMEGRRFNVAIRGVETIGLVPEIVFLDSAMYYMGIKDFSHERLLEKSIQKLLNEREIFFT